MTSDKIKELISEELTHIENIQKTSPAAIQIAAFVMQAHFTGEIAYQLAVMNERESQGCFEVGVDLWSNRPRIGKVDDESRLEINKAHSAARGAGCDRIESGGEVA